MQCMSTNSIFDVPDELAKQLSDELAAHINKQIINGLTRRIKVCEILNGIRILKLKDIIE